MAGAPVVRKATTLTIPVRALIKKADPDFDKERRREVEYDFGPKGRVFRADRSKRGAYE